MMKMTTGEREMHVIVDAAVRDERGYRSPHAGCVSSNVHTVGLIHVASETGTKRPSGVGCSASVGLLQCVCLLPP